MSSLGMYELTHPGSLSEYQLREILKNRCIETISYEKLCKKELLEIYMRIAMPLPQRQRGNAKNFNAEVDLTEESVVTVGDNDTCSLTTDLNKGNKRIFQPPHSQTDRLKSPVNDQKSVHKKIRLCSTSKAETPFNGIIKRRLDEQNEESLMKKRQKITWP